MLYNISSKFKALKNSDDKYFNKKDVVIVLCPSCEMLDRLKLNPSYGKKHVDLCFQN